MALQDKSHFFIKIGCMRVGKNFKPLPSACGCQLKEMAAKAGTYTFILKFREDKHVIQPDAGGQLELCQGKWRVNCNQ